MDRKNRLSLEVFSGSQGIAELHDRWVSLANRCGASQLMQLPDYYACYAKSLASSAAETLVAAFSQGAELVAVMPLSYSETRKAGLTVRQLEFPPTPIPLRDFVAADGVTLDALIHCMRDQFQAAYGKQWDRLRCDGIARPSETKLFSDAANGSVSTSVVGKNNYIQLTDGDYILDSLSGNMRSNLRRRKKKLAKLGEFEFRTVATFPDLEKAYEDFVETEAAGWKSVSGGKRAIKLHPDQKSFYFDLLERFAHRGMAHIHLLELDGRAIASDYCLLAGKSAFSLKHGFDETFSDVTPSNLLREYTIEYYSANEDIEIIDLISGYAWQDRWKPAHRTVRSFSAFNGTLIGRLLGAYQGLQSRRRTR
jgi:CelD/BcsL family acetyltransferase involved in cellulose biosynthesis